MLKINNKIQIKKKLFCLILILLFSSPTFAQFDNPEGAPSDSYAEDEIAFRTSDGKLSGTASGTEGQAGAGPGVAAPIDDYIWVLSVLGLGLAVFKMQEQKQ